MSNHNYDKIRGEILDTIHKGVDAGLIRLSAGNVSARTEDGHIAITPANIPYDEMTPEDIVIVDADGAVVDGSHKPSSELPMHACILQNLPQFNAVFHTHSINAMAFAALAQEIPVVSLEILICGGPIPVAAWACPGTEEAGNQVVELLRARPRLRAVLLRSHGPVMVGETLDDAYRRATDLETGAAVFHQTLQVGSPVIISPDEIAEVHQKYGI